LRKIISLKHGRHLTAAFSRPRAGLRRWIVFVPESGSDFQRGTRRELSHLIGGRLAGRFNFLAINKPGLHPKGTDTAVFERSFRHDRRVQDALKTMSDVIPADHEIYLVGYSEGAYLAPEIAAADSRVCAVMIIGGGTRGWLREEISNAHRRDLREVRRKIREIYRDRRSLRKWQGFSYATWYSYREDSALHALRRLRVPVFAILGARDRTIDLKSALHDLRRLGRTQTVRVRLLHDCGHSFSGHWRTVRRALDRFLRTVL
jgi:pimeloyl-ACP methyl ester carboxylesterase